LKVYPLDENDDPRCGYSLPVTFLAFVPGMMLALARARIECRASPPRLPHGDALRLASVPFWLLGAYSFDWIEPFCVIASSLVLAGAVLGARPGALVRGLDWRPLAAVGVASYSLYVWHKPIVDSLHDRTQLRFLPLLAIALPLCVGVAAASYLAVERPFLRLRRRWGPTAAAEIRERA